jgi:hypothetical protein
MCAAAVHGDPHAVGCGQEWAGVGAQSAGREGQHVLGQRDVRRADQSGQPVLDHPPGTVAELLGGLKQHHHGARPVPGGLGE